MRIRYFVVIVTKGALMKVHTVPALNIIHKIGAAGFLILLLVLYLPK